MIDRRTMLRTCAGATALPRGTSLPREGAVGCGGASYVVEEVEGWRVRLERSLMAREPDLWIKTMRAVRCQLFDIAFRLPPRAVEALRHIEIRVGQTAGERPRTVVLAGWPADAQPLAVELGEARAFVDADRERPWAILHAMALVYHRTRLAGRGRAAVAAAHAAAVASGKYDRELCSDGQYRRHPGLAGPAEYFAAASTALFGVSDCRPFVCAQLREIDPRGYDLVFRLWTLRGLDGKWRVMRDEG